MKATYYTAPNEEAKPHKLAGSMITVMTVIASNRPVVTVKIFGTPHANTCELRIHGPSHRCTRQTGRAGGYGYHRPSAALSEAIDRAGIALSEPIDGRGEPLMGEALKAIAVLHGYSDPIVHEAHAS